MFSCSRCASKFISKNGLQKHTQSFHKQYVCKICDAVFSDYKNHKRHVKEHISRKFKCEKCDQVFKRNDHRNRHMRVHNEDLFNCEYCNRKFKKRKQLERHIVCSHGI